MTAYNGYGHAMNEEMLFDISELQLNPRIYLLARNSLFFYSTATGPRPPERSFDEGSFRSQQFPGPVRSLARALATDPAVELAAIGSMTSRAVKGVDLIKYRMAAGDVSETHPFARRFDAECRRAEQVLYSLSSMVSVGIHAGRDHRPSRLGRNAAAEVRLSEGPAPSLLRVLLRRRRPRRRLRPGVPDDRARWRRGPAE